MFDTMTTTKILGAICGSLLIFLLAEWLADEIYHSGSGGHGGDHKQAYVIEVDEIEETKIVSVE